MHGSTGFNCGSTSIDRAFQRLMKTRFGSAFTGLPLAERGTCSILMDHFENAKRVFGSSGPDSDQFYTIQAPRHFGATESEWYRDGAIILSTYQPQSSPLSETADLPNLAIGAIWGSSGRMSLPRSSSCLKSRSILP